MPILESAEALNPYLSPRYWDKHSINYGEITDELLSPSFGGWENRNCKRELQECVGQMMRAEAEPLEIYLAGHTFDVKTYEPGTIVLLREESLSGRAADMPLNPMSLIDLPKPIRPVDVSVSFTQTGDRTEEAITYGAIGYQTLVKWGIVAVSKNRKNVLRTISAGLVRISEGTVSIDIEDLRPLDNPVLIGETTHSRSRTGIEKVARVNRLHVVAHGKS